MSRDEASRMAAALPSPKKRAVKGPGGWLARHGNRIERRIGIVRRDGLDACVYN
jgi:monofunctional biosynthetic peptidoglycan transglycosylase